MTWTEFLLRRPPVSGGGGGVGRTGGADGVRGECRDGSVGCPRCRATSCRQESNAAVRLQVFIRSAPRVRACRLASVCSGQGAHSWPGCGARPCCECGRTAGGARLNELAVREPRFCGWNKSGGKGARTTSLCLDPLDGGGKQGGFSRWTGSPRSTPGTSEWNAGARVAPSREKRARRS